VTLGGHLALFESQFPHLQSGNSYLLLHGYERVCLARILSRLKT
jgi:hypothetical protein